MNIKDIAATLAILGSGALLTGCGKDKPATEVPATEGAAPVDAAAGGGEAKCGEGHSEEGHCGADEAAPPAGEASCSADAKPTEGEGSCGGK